MTQTTPGHAGPLPVVRGIGAIDFAAPAGTTMHIEDLLIDWASGDGIYADGFESGDH